MTVVRLAGGIGNQMFQYALGRVLAIKNRDNLKLDIERYQTRSRKALVRRFALENFNIHAEIATAAEIQRAKYPLGPFSKLMQKMRGRSAEPVVSFDPAILQRRGSLYLEGFWQSEKYFKEHEETIRKDFTPRQNFGAEAQNVLAEINDAGSRGCIPVSLHVRRGDYVDNPKTAQNFGALSESYYADAIGLLLGTIKAQDIHLFIFSDDIAWVRSHLNLKFPVTYVSRPSIPDWEEIFLMAACRHHIIANSSFSWWGAWLNARLDKVVIAPKHWAHREPSNFKDIVPADWLRV